MPVSLNMPTCQISMPPVESHGTATVERGVRDYYRYPAGMLAIHVNGERPKDVLDAVNRLCASPFNEEETVSNSGAICLPFDPGELADILRFEQYVGGSG